jgi:hypothetical protein
MKIIGIAAVAAITLLCASTATQSQEYARYSYYGGGYGRGLGPSCGHYGCYVQNRYAYQGYRPAPPIRRYTWYGGPPRAYLGGRGGGWGGEW